MRHERKYISRSTTGARWSRAMLRRSQTFVALSHPVLGGQCRYQRSYFPRAPWKSSPRAQRYETEQPIVRSLWLEPACARYSSGWMPTEAASAGSARRIHETAIGRLPIHFWLPASSPQPRLHNQTSYLQGLLRLWTRIRLAQCARSHSVLRCSGPGNGPSSYALNLSCLDPVLEPRNWVLRM